MGQLYWVIVTPLNLLPAAFADLRAPFLLGWVGFVAGLIMYYQAYTRQQRGLSVI
jgi:hypothetical protein|eukprot:COSAG01_NODE_754_length_13831_cov_35.287795_11_plen_55_part_00